MSEAKELSLLRPTDALVQLPFTSHYAEIDDDHVTESQEEIQRGDFSVDVRRYASFFDQYYQTSEQIGHGSTCNVFRGRDNRNLEEPVAIKVATHYGTVTIRHLFEAYLTSRTNDRHLMRCLSCTINPEYTNMRMAMPLFDMELNAVSATELFAKNPNALWVLLAHMSHALLLLHTSDIIHRDVKPGNILIKHIQTEDPDEVPFYFCLCDFSMSIDARKIKSGRIVSRTVTTACYTPPEIILQSRNYNDKIDIFSLACVLYFALYRRHLFSYDSWDAKIASPATRISRMVRITGMPDEQDIEDMKDLPLINLLEQESLKDGLFKPAKLGFGDLEEVMTHMLKFNPKKRWNILAVTKWVNAKLNELNKHEIN